MSFRAIELLILLLMPSITLYPQSYGVVGSKLCQQLYMSFPMPKPPNFPESMQWNGTQVINFGSLVDLPVPRHSPISYIVNLSKSDAISIGIPAATIQEIETIESGWQQQYGDNFGIQSIRYYIKVSGSYVGKFRKTFAVITQGTTDLNDWDYSRYVKEKLESFGWALTTSPARVSIDAFAGIDSVVNNSNADLVFYAGHGSEIGPGVPGCNNASVYDFQWSNPHGEQRGARWFFMQSCRWLFPEYNSGMTSISGDDPNFRWKTAFNSGKGSLHGIFGYASKAWLFSRGTCGSIGFHSTNLAPVACMANIQNGGSNGDSWFLGSHNQHDYENTYWDLYSGWDGEQPAILTVSNWFGDYFYENCNNMWPDPIDADDTAKIVFHTAKIGNPEF